MKAVPYAAKRCACGRVFETIDEWRALPQAKGGLIYSDADEISEYRNCECGSTLVVVFYVSENEDDDGE